MRGNWLSSIRVVSQGTDEVGMEITEPRIANADLVLALVIARGTSSMVSRCIVG